MFHHRIWSVRTRSLSKPDRYIYLAKVKGGRLVYSALRLRRSWKGGTGGVSGRNFVVGEKGVSGGACELNGRQALVGLVGTPRSLKSGTIQVVTVICHFTPSEVSRRVVFPPAS